jgi:hypothetical protein
MVTDIDPTYVVKKKNYLSYMDKTYDLLYLSMSLDLLFQIKSCTRPDEIWTKLEVLFGKQDERPYA